MDIFLSRRGSLHRSAPTMLLSAFLVLAGALYLGHKAWQIIYHSQAPSPLRDGVSSSTSFETPPAILPTGIQATQSLNLFGKLSIEPTAIDAEALPNTTLALQLVGIIGHSNADTARSLIAEAGKPAQAYFPGDTLPGDAKLVRIDRQFVIVQRGEQLEKLQFAGGVSTARTPAKRRSIAEAVTETPAQPVAVAESIDPNNPAAVYDGLRDRLAAIRREQEKP